VKFIITWVLDLFRKPEEEIDPKVVEVAVPKKKPTVKKATTRTKKPAVVAKTVAKKTTKVKKK